MDSTPLDPDRYLVGPALVLGTEGEERDHILRTFTDRGIDAVAAADLDVARERLDGRLPAFVVLCPGGEPDPERVVLAHAAALDAFDTSIGHHTGDRQEFHETVERILRQAQRRNTTLAILCLELASATPNNPALSVEARERLSSVLVDRLRASLRDRDVMARVAEETGDLQVAALGRQRFLLMLELRRAHDASNVGRRLLELLTQPITVDEQAFSPGFFIGVSLFPHDTSSSEELLKLAERAARLAREDGVNSVRYCSDSMNSAALEMLSMESALRRALRDEELLVYYQPKVEIATERIVGMEALVRWRHPELGMVSPGQFIPLAEDTGLISPIGEWVLRRACEDSLEWQRSGLPPIQMAVNLSSVQFRDPNLYESVIGTIESTGLDPRHVELELTESMLMEDAEKAVGILNRFKQHGIKISIDDFGTGYSSLSYLKRFPIDALKIDRSFITEVNTNPDDASISTSIILMGRSLKLRVIAEGVETRSQLSFLRVMQCDEVQGFLFSPPVPADQAKALLERQDRRGAA